jgi:hypothetical protein
MSKERCYTFLFSRSFHIKIEKERTIQQWLGTRPPRAGTTPKHQCGYSPNKLDLTTNLARHHSSAWANTRATMRSSESTRRPKTLSLRCSQIAHTTKTAKESNAWLRSLRICVQHSLKELGPEGANWCQPKRWNTWYHTERLKLQPLRRWSIVLGYWEQRAQVSLSCRPCHRHRTTVQHQSCSANQIVKKHFLGAFTFQSSFAPNMEHWSTNKAQ